MKNSWNQERTVPCISWQERFWTDCLPTSITDKILHLHMLHTTQYILKISQNLSKKWHFASINTLINQVLDRSMDLKKRSILYRVSMNRDCPRLTFVRQSVCERVSPVSIWEKGRLVAMLCIKKGRWCELCCSYSATKKDGPRDE